MKTLSDTVTRYEALQDLKNVWEDGLYAVKKMKPEYRGKGEAIMQKSLEGALALLQSQMDLLSNYDTKKFSCMREINAIKKAESIELSERELEARERRQNQRASIHIDESKPETGKDIFN